MATYRSGANSRIVIGKEPSFGATDPTPVGHVLRKASFQFNPQRELVQNPELRSDPNPSQDERGLNTVTARLVAPMTYDEFGLICYLFFGSYAVTGTSPTYTHTFKVSATEPPSCWVEVGDEELSKYDLFQGLVVRSINLGTISNSSNIMMVTVEFESSGQFTLNSGTEQDASPDTYDNPIHVMKDVQVKVDGSATTVINEISYGISRPVSMYRLLNGNPYAAEADLQRYAFDFNIRGWRDSSDTIWGLDDCAEHTVEIISPEPVCSGSPTYQVSIDHDECRIFQSVDSGGADGDGPIIVAASVRPFYQDNASASSVVVTVTGEVADYSAIW